MGDRYVGVRFAGVDGYMDWVLLLLTSHILFCFLFCFVLFCFYSLTDLIKFYQNVLAEHKSLF